MESHLFACFITSDEFGLYLANQEGCRSQSQAPCCHRSIRQPRKQRRRPKRKPRQGDGSFGNVGDLGCMGVHEVRRNALGMEGISSICMLHHIRWIWLKFNKPRRMQKPPPGLFVCQPDCARFKGGSFDPIEPLPWGPDKKKKTRNRWENNRWGTEIPIPLKWKWFHKPCNHNKGSSGNR